ncbi:hypothetical protein ACIBHX_46300 [Nonomuraea sp. NPDC050536]|uniref:hypothetical protein n=1 Tax=Nonomuraea sp. NPDC050536 TaxID=3364366 RepID=UPI0037C8ECB1
MELAPRNTAIAQQAASTAGLGQVEVMTADAALTDCYQGIVPADLVLACGVFGNITDDDIQRTIGYCSQLCDNGATIIWTRHRATPDRVPLICDWFEERGFERRWLSDPEAGFGVGVHRSALQPSTSSLIRRLARSCDASASSRWPWHAPPWQTARLACGSKPTFVLTTSSPLQLKQCSFVAHRVRRRSAPATR